MGTSGGVITLIFALITAYMTYSPAAAALEPKQTEAREIIQIIVDNRRESNTTVHCCSGDDDLCQKVLEPSRYYNFAFTPNIIGTTLFNCRATWVVVLDPVAPEIRTYHKSWIAYAESEGNNQDSAIFELRESGIYINDDFLTDWDFTDVFPPVLPPLCHQFPTPCQAKAPGGY